jgi:phospholipid transport system transporter-binding protein
MVSFNHQGQDCRLSGRLLQEQVIDLWPDRHKLLHDEVQTLELSGLEYSDSAGISFLLTLVQQARDAGRELKLTVPSPQLQKLIDLYDLHAFFS